jgi:hypothetical protein
MTTLQNNKCSDKTAKVGEVRMGREVTNKKTNCTDSEHDAECADKKEKTRMDNASSLV